MMRILTGLLVCASLMAASCDPEAPEPDARPSPLPSAPADLDLAEAVTTEGMREHLRALDRIARENGGNRAAGTSGYDASVAYVREVLDAAGYEDAEVPFPFAAFEDLGGSGLALDDGTSFEPGVDLKPLLYSAPGSATGPLFFTASTGPGGCSTEAFSEMQQGSIAVVHPAPCFNRDQVINASGAGAAGVVFVFPDEAGQSETLRHGLGSPESIDVPVLGISGGAGEVLAGHADERATITADVMTESRTTSNVIASSPGGEGPVVMLGGHLDSVIDGPGINDNGSGIAALLEIAEELPLRDLRTRVRFAFWSGEELGLLGSSHYVDSLTDEERDEILVYLNFDMLGSPNFVRYIYDDTGAGDGSADITERFDHYFDAAGLPSETIDLAGRSDHGSFLEAGIDIGGLFTGANMIKTSAEATLYGGEAGGWEDPCYHQACDDIDNVDLEVLDEMADAIAVLLSSIVLPGVPP